MISLCMITRNEEQYLARCLNSVRAIVDEIILVDTGSADRTIDVARLFGAQVYDFVWNDDFSAARNFSLSKSSGDCVFSLDADEIISEQDHIYLKRLSNEISNRGTAFTLVTRNYTNDPNQVGWMPNDGGYRCEEAGCGYIPTEKVRFFPNHKSIRYEYAIHEMVEPSLNREGVEIKGCGIPIHHYGPLAKDNRNIKMLAYYRMGKNKLAQLGDHVIALRELAIQASILGKPEEAIELWEKFIILKPDMSEAFVHLGTAYFQLKNYQAALQAAKKALTLNPNMKEAIYNYALCEFVIGDIVKTVSCLKNIVAKYPGYLPARFVLAAAQICSCFREEGLKNIVELSRTRMGPNLAATCKDLAQRLLDINRPDWAKKLFECAAKQHGVLPYKEKFIGI
jgi:glycosyltransferase involved in cell wall biosynthesis